MLLKQPFASRHLNGSSSESKRTQIPHNQSSDQFILTNNGTSTLSIRPQSAPINKISSDKFNSCDRNNSPVFKRGLGQNNKLTTELIYTAPYLKQPLAEYYHSLRLNHNKQQHGPHCNGGNDSNKFNVKLRPVNSTRKSAIERALGKIK